MTQYKELTLHWQKCMLVVIVIAGLTWRKSVISNTMMKILYFIILQCCILLCYFSI